MYPIGFQTTRSTHDLRTGFTRQETLAKTTLSLGMGVDPQERERVEAEMQANSRIRNYEFDVRIRSGKILRAEFSGETIKIGDEDFIVAVIRDISEHKRMEKFLHLRLKLWEFSITHSASELMQKALDEIEELTGSQVGFYHFVDEETNTLTLQAWSTRTQNEFCKAEGAGAHSPIDETGVWAECV